MIIIASLLMNLAFGETFDVFFSPMRIIDQTTSGRVSVNHDRNATFHYTAQYARLAEAPNGTGGYHSIKNNYDDIRVYNRDTIELAYPSCDYFLEPLRCSVNNNHYYVESVVTFNDDQLVVRTTLYDKDGTVINTSSRTDEMEIRWIKQQETTVIQQSGMMGNQTIVHTPKEELPLKWEIPYRLFQNHIQQASMGLWLGIKIE